MKFFIVIFLLLTSNIFAQTESSVLPEPPPGNIKMLPGYIHKTGRHTDTYDGTISKKNGIEIYYDMGRLAGNYALFHYKREKGNLIWSKVQKINGLKLRISYLKDGSIYATFGKWDNFISTVKTNEELSDFLTIIMTYVSNETPTDKNKSS
jgi:hypothetical protein